MRSAIAIVAAVALTGCVSPAVYDAGPYLAAKAVEPPSELQGTWTGALGPYLATLQMGPDGRGTMCYSWGMGEYTEQAKYTGAEIYLKGSGSVAVSASDDGLILSPSATGSGDHLFYPDPGLDEAADYCRDKLGT